MVRSLGLLVVSDLKAPEAFTTVGSSGVDSPEGDASA